MSTEADSIVFESSVMDHSEPDLFNERKINFITDSTSNSGAFNAGQINFDLSTFSSANWQALAESYIEFPVKITAKLTTASAGGTGAPLAAAGAFAAVCKNGFHQWISSASLIVNGQTIQSQQPSENVAASFRILSGWSQDTLQKWGKTTGFALDDCTGDGDASTTYSQTTGLNNAAYATVATAIRGFDAVNNQTSLLNKGPIARAQLLNSNTVATSMAGTVLSGNFATTGKSNVGVAAATNTVNTAIYSQFIMATCRVKDLFDINEFPLVKNMKGYMYLTFNSTQSTVTNALAAQSAVSAWTATPMTGGSCPYNILTGSEGIVFSGGTGTATTAPVVTIVGTIDGTATDAVGLSAPILTNARLLMPYYSANPRADAALAKIQKFSTLEKIVNPFAISANNYANVTITVGVPNPTKIVLLPLLQNLGGSTLPNPELSIFDTSPATSSPFARLSSLQITVANRPVFQYPIDYDAEFYFNEISQLGANGGKLDEMTSGILNQQLWEQNHRYYCVDLARRLPSDNGMSRSVQVSCRNPSAFPMKVIAILWYQKNWEINTSTCQIQAV